jgi:hypothetical protein
MEQKQKGQTFSKVISKRTVHGVTKLLDRVKKCQATAKYVLENKKKACVKNENGILNKCEEEKALESIEDDTSIVREKIDSKQNTCFHASVCGSKCKTSQFEKEKTLKDGNLHSNTIENRCILSHARIINDNMIEQSSDNNSNTMPLGVQTYDKMITF